jgi:hypothetical protein
VRRDSTALQHGIRKDRGALTVTPQRRYRTAVISAFLLFTSVLFTPACTKEPPPPAKEAPERPLLPPPAPTTQSVLQKTFNLKGTATFPFEIPAHELQPHLHGIFESFVGQAHGSSDDAANISFLILNEEQYADFAGNRAWDSLFSIEASHNQAVNFDLPPAMNQSMKYYLVFQSPAGNRGSLVVEANFRVDF